MIVEHNPTINGVTYRGFGFTWYKGVSIVFNVWDRRVSWSPWWIRR